MPGILVRREESAAVLRKGAVAGGGSDQRANALHTPLTEREDVLLAFCVSHVFTRLNLGRLRLGGNSGGRCSGGAAWRATRVSSHAALLCRGISAGRY